jgi:hypothetical protein
MDMPEFREYPKIARLNREVIVTEKIDGTNAAVIVTEDGRVFAQSRTQVITAPNDNHGFRAWVEEHAEDLKTTLGAGVHFGEWWGSGIQRGYGLPKGEKRFSLFNVDRWQSLIQPFAPGRNVASIEHNGMTLHVVPVLWRGLFDTTVVRGLMDELREKGSRAVPGFMHPEGVVVWHVQGRFGLKATLERDEQPKGVPQA